MSFWFDAKLHFLRIFRRQIDLISIKGATNIAGSKFDDPKHPIADDGELDDSITPAQYVSFVDLIDDTQLARFGLHNGKFLQREKPRV